MFVLFQVSSASYSTCGVKLEIDEDSAQKLDLAASSLSRQLSSINQGLDESDATESSSGGESEGEAEFDAELIQQYKSTPL
jgi:hypothetical protein